jgi:hypothetical protein
MEVVLLPRATRQTTPLQAEARKLVLRGEGTDSGAIEVKSDRKLCRSPGRIEC